MPHSKQRINNQTSKEATGLIPGVIIGSLINALRGESIGRGAVTGGITGLGAGFGGALGGGMGIGAGGAVGGALGGPGSAGAGMLGGGLTGIGIGAPVGGYLGYQLAQHIHDKYRNPEPAAAKKKKKKKKTKKSSLTPRQNAQYTAIKKAAISDYLKAMLIGGGIGGAGGAGAGALFSGDIANAAEYNDNMADHGRIDSQLVEDTLNDPENAADYIQSAPKDHALVDEAVADLPQSEANVLSRTMRPAGVAAGNFGARNPILSGAGVGAGLGAVTGLGVQGIKDLLMGGSKESSMNNVRYVYGQPVQMPQFTKQASFADYLKAMLIGGGIGGAGGAGLGYLAQGPLAAGQEWMDEEDKIYNFAQKFRAAHPELTDTMFKVIDEGGGAAQDERLKEMPLTEQGAVALLQAAEGGSGSAGVAARNPILSGAGVGAAGGALTGLGIQGLKDLLFS